MRRSPQRTGSHTSAPSILRRPARHCPVCLAWRRQSGSGARPAGAPDRLRLGGSDTHTRGEGAMPMTESARLLQPELGRVTTWGEYRARGGGEAYRVAAETDPAFVIDALRAAGLRGRGGAGFPTATKWRGIFTSRSSRRFICCNGAEGEPGTFKDRWILRHNPFQVLEGLAIGALVLSAERAYLGLKASFDVEAAATNVALAEMQRHLPAAKKIELVLGPDEYLFGEEKALLEVIEGGLPLPRVFPPYIHGLFTGAYGGPNQPDSNPVAVNNVETLAHVSHILRNGPDWFRQLGTEESPGTMVFTLSGDIRRPCIVELPLGLTLRTLIEQHAGGIASGRPVKAVFPGAANRVITPDLLDVPLGFDSMAQAGSSLGSGGFIVYDDRTCMVDVAHTFSRFLYVESCNQCPPCKLGSREITGRLEALLQGRAEDDTVEEIEDIATWVTNARRCYLAVSEQLVISSIVAAYPDDFVAHLEGRCTLEHDRPLPKMVDYVEGEGFRFDTNYQSKQPDWTYASERDQ
ncbi:MAG: hypothetical protein GEU80_16795 [Dehalococcoidia bacterium]|nr:hypothetical protein [Dehalococcoidia bacterium]